MPIDTLPSLIAALEAGNLLSDDQLREIRTWEPHRFPKPRDATKELVERGWLTRFQAKQVLRDRYRELTLGSYRLLEQLGEGGMGHVYKALHLPMNRIVALKVVKPAMLADPQTLK